MDTVIEMRNITKRFPGVTACDDVSINFARSEIHALLGENGAGKTTLMNVLYGLLKADDGEILLNGQPVDISSPLKAIELGIGMVHQHFKLVRKFTVLENIVLGTKMPGAPRLVLSEARKKIEEIQEKTGLRVDIDKRIYELGVGDQQRVEILKALYRGVSVLIMDEPTAVLTPQETDELFPVLLNWVKEGNTVIFITHKLREVQAYCDRVSVLRDGKMIGTDSAEGLTAEDLAKKMVGREIKSELERTSGKPGETVLEVRDLSVCNEYGREVVKDVNFDVRAGEVLGVAGVDGNGQAELIEAILGVRRSSGSIHLYSQDLTGKNTGSILGQGVSVIPFNRQTEGLILSFGVQENFILKERWNEPFAGKVFLRQKSIREQALAAIKKYNIKCSGPETHVENMSGGNQQKVIVAREMEREHDLLVACNPTRGVDIGAIEFIHTRILNERDSGKAVLLISTEISELLALSDRIIVLFKGEVMGEVEPLPEAVHQIGLMMLGKTSESA